MPLPEPRETFQKSLEIQVTFGTQPNSPPAPPPKPSAASAGEKCGANCSSNSRETFAEARGRAKAAGRHRPRQQPEARSQISYPNLKPQGLVFAWIIGPRGSLVRCTGGDSWLPWLCSYFRLLPQHREELLRLPTSPPAPVALLRSNPSRLLPTAAPTQSASTTILSAPACGLNPPDIFGAILFLCCYFARGRRVIPQREGSVHCRADGRAHLAAPRPPEERHKAQARAPPHRGAADREERRGRACA